MDLYSEKWTFYYENVDLYFFTWGGLSEPTKLPWLRAWNPGVEPSLTHFMFYIFVYRQIFLQFKMIKAADVLVLLLNFQWGHTHYDTQIYKLC